jgi:hypothetical protein
MSNKPTKRKKQRIVAWEVRSKSMFKSKIDVDYLFKTREEARSWIGFDRSSWSIRNVIITEA